MNKQNELGKERRKGSQGKERSLKEYKGLREETRKRYSVEAKRGVKEYKKQREEISKGSLRNREA